MRVFESPVWENRSSDSEIAGVGGVRFAWHGPLFVVVTAGATPISMVTKTKP